MKYISPHKVLAKGTIRIIIPAFLSFFVLLALSIFVGAEINSALGIIIGILTFIVPIFIYQHFYLNWLAWAVKYVDDIPHFLKEGSGNYLLININRFPAVKTFFPYKEKKKEIENTVLERKEKGLYVVELNNDVPYFSETHFYQSIALNAGLLLLGLFFLIIGVLMPLEVTLWGKIFFIIIGLPITYWTIKGLLDREPAFSISRFGVKSKKLNLSWTEIEDITVERIITGIGKHQRIKDHVEIKYRENDGTLNTAKVDISGLNISIAKADEVIKGYKQKYLTSNVE